MSIAWLIDWYDAHRQRLWSKWTLGLVILVMSGVISTAWYVLQRGQRTYQVAKRTAAHAEVSDVLGATPQPTSIASASATPAITPNITSTITPTAAPVVKRRPSSAEVPAPKITSNYPVHANILTTVFWAGESATSDNSFISNAPSAWMDDWTSHFGGVDAPSSRNGYLPSGFTPKENSFYFALPYSDYSDSGPKANVTKVYWYKPFADGQSILKNRWLAVTFNGKTAYAQWEDVGPYQDDDINYVFGSAKPIDKVGLDVSPAVKDYLGMGDTATTSRRFVDDAEVPDGPWKVLVTTSGPDWN